MSEQTQTPRILWAQQREHVLLTVAVPDIEKVDVKFEENSVSFQGQSTSSDTKAKTTYAVKIDLYEKIDPTTSKHENVGQKFWRLLLKKKDPSGKFWPRLTKEKTRLHWLQVDFDHWKDEDESDDEKGGFGGNFQDMFSGGMGGMPGLGDMPDMGEEDSDDEEGASATSTDKPDDTPNGEAEKTSTPTSAGEGEQSA